MNAFSSVIEEIDYNVDAKELIIEFKNGSVYVYSDVPNSVFIELFSAQSRGKFFHANVKNNFIFRKEK